MPPLFRGSGKVIRCCATAAVVWVAMIGTPYLRI
jgi:hypothetical protein